MNELYGMNEIVVASSLDGSHEPSLYYRASGTFPRPLLVGLHTWSADRFNQIRHMLPYAQKYNWHLVLPEFRGPNITSNPRCREACGSRLAKQDIVDVTNYLIENENIDYKNIFITGASGGGHMALLMAAYAPDLWRAAASFVPVTDLIKWHSEMKNYGDGKYSADIEACCGGPPSESTFNEYHYRSPINWIDEISKCNVTIFTGKYDRQILPTHTMELYNRILSKHLDSKTFLCIFDGEHEQRMDYAVEWFIFDMGKT